MLAPFKPFGHMAHLAKDQLYVFGRGLMFTTPCVAAEFSARFHVMIAVSASGKPFTVAGETNSHEVSAVVLRPTRLRRLNAVDASLVVFLADASHPDFARFRAIGGDGILPLDRGLFTPYDDALAAAGRGELDALGAQALADDMVATTLRVVPSCPQPDPRMLSLLEHLQTCGRTELAQLAAVVQVSPDHLSHIFTSSIGLPLRSYLLWRKLRMVEKLLSPTRSMTDVAHAAGFADSPHMRRTFAESFGAPPSYFCRGDQVRVVRELPVSHVDVHAPALEEV